MNDKMKGFSVSMVRMLTLFSLLAWGTACEKQGTIVTIEGSSDQATEVRTNLNNGRALFAQVRSEIDSILMTLGASQIARMLMFEPAAGGQAKIHKNDLVKLLGEYNELAAGIFSFIPDINASFNDSIRINYMNGVDLRLHSFKYSLSGQLIEIGVFATSNNRNIVTPEDAPKAINGKVFRTDIPDILSWLEPSTISLDGNASYYRNGEVVTVSIERAAGEITNNILPTSLLNTKTSYFKVWDVTETVGLRNSAPFWHEETEVTYAPTSLVFIWNMTNTRQTYIDSTGIHYEVNISFDSNASVPQNHYAYKATSQIRYNKPDDNDLEWYKVAITSGGPFICAYTTAASGDPLTVNWYDLSIDQIMPTTEINCSTAIKVANNV